jgi:hypothetical protein
MPFYLGHSYASSFAHLHDFVPHWKNHIIPHYGVFSKFYFGRMVKSCLGQGEKYTSFKKNQGPPHYSWKARYDPLEHNEILMGANVSPNAVRQFQPRVVIGEEPHH